MASNSQDPIIRRRRLHNQYKAIERQIIPSLFAKGTNIQTWSKIAVLRGVTSQHDKLEDNVRNIAAARLTTAIDLRKQAMPLWPVGTDAEKRHWDWINILERITNVLKTSAGPDEAVARLNIVHSTPAEIVKDESPWTNADLDIYLQQMSHWRQTLIEIWQAAIDDPTQLSVADISDGGGKATGCAVRYFKMEMAGMEVCNEEWYEKSGSFKPKTLEYMARREPDGIGGDLFKIHQSVRRKKVWHIEKDLEHTEFHGFPPNTNRWIFADSARHSNPLVDWETVPSLAVAYTWADYINVMINLGLSYLPTLTITMFVFEANCILKRWPTLPAGTDVEQFCNLFGELVFPTGRPRSEAGWKAAYNEWMEKMVNPNVKERLKLLVDRFTDPNILDRYGKSWVRIAVIEDHLMAKSKDFKVTKGTTKWWEAIKKRVSDELQVPSIVAMLQKVDKAYPIEDHWSLVEKILKTDWVSDRPTVDRVLDDFVVPVEWFNGVTR
ncbi:hypothetical protein NUW58_g3360 [Xylaria curta]|uniref:Uncharacterized protein n=1 Tax=Xylaria curta TaxID=42375 RepID=A0ACC1PCB0_9PEZI|nr:hypothetical protein NUW58_g3360 [Xylaria curta]